jgi:hypothetical protein
LKNFIKTGAWPRSIEAAIEAGNKLCLGEATTPFYIMVSICLKNWPQKNFGADGIPFAHFNK